MVVTDRSGSVADAEFLTTAAGYIAAVAFLDAYGMVTVVGVEEPRRTAWGLSVPPVKAGLTVVEAKQPDKDRAAPDRQIRSHVRLPRTYGAVVKLVSCVSLR